MTFPFFWREPRPGVRAEDRLGRLRKVLDHCRPLAMRSLPSGGSTLQPFLFPLSGVARIALLESGFLPDRNMRDFSAGDIAELHSYAPEALVLSLDLALSLADQKRRGLFDLPSLKIALVVVSSLENSPLPDDYRDQLWRAFEVPVFEQLRGSGGTIVARECEVHDGLHMDENAGIAGEFVTGLCDCGNTRPRVRNLSRVLSKTAAA